MDAYIVAGFRTAVGKAKKGGFRFTRPDDLAAAVIRHLVSTLPSFDKNLVDDIIVGNAIPEAEQGMQIGRMIALLALSKDVPGMTVNRYCGSGLEAINIAASRIHAGMADCIIAGGTESMSLVPMLGWKTALNYSIATKNPDYYTSMGLTAEIIANRDHITRDDQDEFALSSHQKALNAMDNGYFKEEIIPVTIEETYLDENEKRQKRTFTVETDEGPRRDTNMEVLKGLKPAFAKNGTVTAGNSSQTSDGAAFVILFSEKLMKQFDLHPVSRLITYSVAGVDPEIMGLGPVEAVPKALKRSGLNLHDIDLIELNEAFAAQSLAVMRKLDLDSAKVNVNGGAIALGHPLGCTGAKLTVQVIHELIRRKGRYGMVTACVGGGQGVAGIFELLN